MIYQLLIIMLLIVLGGAITPIAIEKTVNRKKKVKQLVTAKYYPKDLLEGGCE